MALVEGDGGSKKKPAPKKPAPKPSGYTVGGRPAAAPGGARVDAVSKPKSKPKPRVAGSGRSGDEVRQPVVPNAPVYTGGPLNVKAILDYGMSLRGTPYVWGGESLAEGGFDCSGLLYEMFRKAGVNIPRVSRDQARAGTAVSAKDARPGDLVAFDWDPKRPGIDHIGIYLGGGKMLVAPRTGDVVKVQSVDLGRAATIRRVVPDEAYTTLRQSDGSYQYVAGQQATPQGKAGPTNSGPAAGGGDIASAPNPATGQMVFPPTTTSQQVISGTAPLPGATGKDAAGNPQYRMEDYGFAAAFFKSDPELKSLVDQAIANDWSPEKFAVMLKGTKWYTTRSAAERQFAADNTSDRASVNRRIEIRAEEIRRTAVELGATLSPEEIKGIATSSIKYGYSEQETLGRITTMGFDGDEPFTGKAGVTQDALARKAGAFGVGVGPARMAQWVKDIVQGLKTEEDFDNWVKEQAKILYPALAGQIDKGVTPEDVAQLYVGAMSQVLELNPGDIEWAKDPLIQKAMSNKSPDEKDASAMPIWAFEQELKKDPRWLQTNGAANSFMGVAGQVLKDWGVKF